MNKSLNKKNIKKKEVYLKFNILNSIFKYLIKTYLTNLFFSKFHLEL